MSTALFGGAMLGLGVSLLLRALLPVQPSLEAVFDRLGGPGPVRPTGSLVAGPTLQGKVGMGLARWLRDRSWVRVPRRDLELLGVPENLWFGEKGLLALLGLLTPPLLTLLMNAAGTSPPLTMPVVGSLALGVLFWFLPDLSVRARARLAREDFARAVGAYIELTALERAAGAGATEAMEQAAEIGQSWVFVRVREQLRRASWSGTPPWVALAQLGDELGVSALTELADVMRLSGEEGAAVYETLRARSRSLRSGLLLKEQARANANSERLVMPVACLGLIFIALLGTPAVLKLAGG